MSNIKQIVFLMSLALVACQETSHPTEPRPHPVSVKQLKRIDSRIYLSANGFVTSRNASRYQIDIVIPNGVIPDLSNGALLKVNKVYSRSTNLKAKVNQVTDSKIQAEVVSDLHDLRGHSLSFEIPVKSNSLFAVPISSVVSPRGTNSFVFEVNNGIATSIEVTPIQVYEQNNLIVSAKLNEKSNVVTEGLENLLSGDKVKIFEGGVR